MRPAAFALALLLALGARAAAESGVPAAQALEPASAQATAPALAQAAPQAPALEAVSEHAPKTAPTPAPAAEATATPPSAPVTAGVSGAARPLTPAAFVDAVASALDGELALLDGGPLSAALLDLARTGRPLRLLLDPGQRSTRLQGAALQAASATAQVRWKHRAGKLQRRLLADGQAVLQWAPAGDPAALSGEEDLAKARQRFERQWAGALESLPEAQRLDDALMALPDPTENSPHFIRRREASGE